MSAKRMLFTFQTTRSVNDCSVISETYCDKRKSLKTETAEAILCLLWNTKQNEVE